MCLNESQSLYVKALTHFRLCFTNCKPFLVLYNSLFCRLVMQSSFFVPFYVALNSAVAEGVWGRERESESEQVRRQTFESIFALNIFGILLYIFVWTKLNSFFCEYFYLNCRLLLGIFSVSKQIYRFAAADLKGMQRNY